MAAIDEKEYTQSFDWRIWKRLGPFLRPYRGGLRVHAGVQRHLRSGGRGAAPVPEATPSRTSSKQNTLTGLLPYALAYLAVILVQALSVVIFARNSMHIEMNLGKDMRAGIVSPSADPVLLLL